MPQNDVPGRARTVASPVVVEATESRQLFSAAISFGTLNGVPGSGNLAFNRIQNPNPAITEVVHDTSTLHITNTGNQPLVIGSLSLSDTTNWQLVNPPAAGTAVAAGHTLDVTIKFVAQSVPPNQPVDETNDTVSTDGLPPSQTGGVWDATLTVNSNDPSAPAASVPLAGYWQLESEHEEEPNLQTIINRLYGFGTRIADDPQPQYLNNGTTAIRYGEEVLSPYWQAADSSQPISVTQIAAYHNEIDQNNGQSPAATIGWFAQGSTTTTKVLQHAANNSQSLLPNLFNTSNTPAVASFSPGSTVFGWNIDGESSVDSQNTVDINTFGRSGHTDRFYPARDSQGNLIPNTWIVGMDYQNGSYDNFDYQDNLYLITNVHPSVQAPAPTNLQASAASGQVTLQWTAVKDASLQGYNVYRADSAGGTFTKLNSSPFNGTSFVDSSPAAATEFYLVSAVDSAGESEKAAVNATLVGGGSPPPPPPPSSGPDLTVSAVAGKFAKPVVGNTMSGPTRVTVANTGTQTAKGTIEIDEFLSASSSAVSTGAPEVTHITRNVNLKAGKSMTFALPGFKYPSNLNGQVFVVAQVRDIKGITETDTTNNLGASPAITIAAPFVDLHNLFTGPLPAALTPGKHTVLQVPVINNGNVTARGMATVTVTATTNSSGAGGTTLATIKRPIVLAAGKTARLSLPFLVPTLAHGTYFVVTNVSLPGDANASNNTGISTGTFTV